MLFDRSANRQFIVEFAVVAEHDPTLSTHLGHPLIVANILLEFEFVTWIVMKLDGKWRTRHPY